LPCLGFLLKVFRYVLATLIVAAEVVPLFFFEASHLTGVTLGATLGFELVVPVDEVIKSWSYYCHENLLKNKCDRCDT
jgi:hypothetical protein